MSDLTTILTQVVTKIAQDMKAVETAHGSLAGLTTDHKTNLVGAINEVLVKVQAIGGPSQPGVQINDGAAESTTAWSGQKITESLANLKTEILGGADQAWDTLKEIEEYIKSDQSSGAALATAVNNRVRFDEAQVLTPEQKKQACANIGVGDITINLVDTYTQAKA